MRKLIITVSIIILFYNFCFAQTHIEEYNAADFDLIGTINDKPVFRYIYSSHDIIGELPKGFHQWGLYQLELINDQCNLKFYKERELEFGRAYFISERTEIYWDYSEPTVLKVKIGENIFDIHHKSNIIQKPSFYELRKGNIVYSILQGNKYINIIRLNQKTNKTNLPLLGKTLFAKNGYLYFDYHHISKNRATPCPVDLYRVKIGDWNNPELLAEFISDSWLPLNDSIVLMTLPVKGRGKQVYYNVNNKTYVETETKLPTTYIKYEGNDYLLGVKRDEYGINKYALQPYPDIPEHGYKKDNQREILPRVLDVNLPNKDKQFSGTFITDELLYNATKGELKKLSKEKLRIIRNAFYARQGYSFKSDDLKKFFGQFEWYNQLLESNEFFELSNEDVVIAPIDKERVELILEIENSK
ncbi:MAG: YARHG domain-containing protein [Bacteroidota bacterium]